MATNFWERLTFEWNEGQRSESTNVIHSCACMTIFKTLGSSPLFGSYFDIKYYSLFSEDCVFMCSSGFGDLNSNCAKDVYYLNHSLLG